MSSLPNFYHDRQDVSSLPKGLYEELRDHYLIMPDDQRVTFTGMVLTESGISIFLPRNSSIESYKGAAGLRYASLLMKGLRRYLKDRTNQELDNDGDGFIGGAQFSVITDLLDDYCTHGLYTQRFCERVTNSGKPDWRRTVASNVAFPGDLGPVYLDIFGTRQRYISDCEVSRIHASIIRELDQSYSWIITGSSIPVAQGIEGVPLSVVDKNTKISILERELMSVYSEQEIRLINLLIKYIKNTHGRRSSELIGMRHFHSMWESMLDSSLKWVFPVNRLLAIPAYRFNDNSLLPAATKGQRTDTVMKHPIDKRFVVVDAKYYGAHDVKSAPGWGDIVKQFFYAKALKVFSENAEVDNVFIFPGNGPLRSIHMQDRKSKALLLNQNYPPIRCIYIDPMTLLEHYVSGIKLEDLSNQLMLSRGNSSLS